jgi:hypothetical protein
MSYNEELLKKLDKTNELLENIKFSQFGIGCLIVIAIIAECIK